MWPTGSSVTDMQTLIRSLAMAPLSTDTVRQVLEEHDELLAERRRARGNAWHG